MFNYYILSFFWLSPLKILRDDLSDAFRSFDEIFQYKKPIVNSNP